jgi:nitrite reductase/ring-hydroxylating ferredoxin subunit
MTPEAASPTPLDEPWHPLCNERDVQEGGLAVPFDVVFGGQVCRAFAIRYQGQVHAYLNRCSHVAMELDWRANHFFDDDKLHLVCASHGAMFDPASGQCKGGPGRGPLHKISIQSHQGVVYWQSQYNLKPFEF